ncbi:helix-turn-helix transcriptional regulator [Sphingobium sp. CFD-2]|uniref:helix-turn-helix domain-containing protein n=1 Tax=Sphingobium sp. CFD-2 TaxID=2878542 RepID=UPI00065C7E3E|nr:helix-turn-helix transcriptional regulator [Sphingobium sp. CFD-2]
MQMDIFSILGDQLRHWRGRRSMSQLGLARRLGRDRARISELERDLIGGRRGRDRLTLFAEICDALDLVPVLVPRAQASAVRNQVEGARGIDFNHPVRSTFEELFVDLDEDEEENR